MFDTFLIFHLSFISNSDETERNQWIYSYLHFSSENMEEIPISLITREDYCIRPYTKNIVLKIKKA